MAVSTDTMMSLADVLSHVPGIAPERIRLHPVPGTATEADVEGIHVREKRRFELFDGILVEKSMGYRESAFACALIRILHEFVTLRNLGIISGESGTMRFFPGLVLIPDVAFVSWARVPGGKFPIEPIPNLVPDLAIEVLSSSNTPVEMRRKREEYFRAGVTLVWEIDPEKRTLVRYTDPESSQLFQEDAVVSGEPALPGFSLNLAELFSELDRIA